MNAWKTMTVATAAVLGVAATPAKAIDLTVTHWGVLMYGAPFAVAREKGFFAEEGVDVTGFLTSQGGGTTLRNALAADVPYGEVSLAAVVAAALQGLDLTIVHAGVRSVGDILWVTRNDADDIEGIEDLAGRGVSYTSPRSVSQMTLIMSLDAAGMSIDDVEDVSLGGVGAGLTALREGAVDAALILEPVWTQNREGFEPVFFAGDLLPTITQTVGVVRTDYLEANEEQIRGIVAARARGVAYIYENVEEAGEILARAYDLDEAVAKEAIANVAAIRYWSEGDFEFDGMDNMVQGLRLVGAIADEPVDWSPLVTEDYLPANLRSSN
ncbi:MAG: ABC transporter substrate-binding protein [Pseudomonadota bacterium]